MGVARVAENARVVLKEVPLSNLDERTLLGDGHTSASASLWYRTAFFGDAQAGFVVVDGEKIVKLGVHKDFRRRGVGSALLLEAVARVRRARPEGTVELYVRPDNDAAIYLYRKHGFRRRAVLHGFYGEGQPAVRMELALGAGVTDRGR